MPTFYLDEEPIEFEEGETILRAALRAGREIPHYCYHPGLEVTAQCRMCLVDITDMGNGRGMPKLQTSCSSPAAEGMKVESKSDKVQAGQNQVMEFLLVNHPLDCPICDQAGECDLQNYSFAYGTGQSEMEYEKRVYGWREVGSFIVLERNRCIHCSRCERFSRDLVGTHDFGAFLRSHETTFDTFEDAQITHHFQGNLADICPVGCIMNRDSRFKKRIWKLKKTPSVCTSCSTGCNVDLEQHKNVLYRLKPRENQEVNRWWMCDEGRINFRSLNDRKSRFLEPLARVKGQLSPAGWDAVYSAIAKRAGEIGAKGEEVAILADTQATNEELYLAQKLAGQVWQSDNVFFPLRSGESVMKPPKADMDPFLYSLINSDKSPNMAGAVALGLKGDEGDKEVKAALKKQPKILIVLGAPWAFDDWARQAAEKSEMVIQIGLFHGRWSEIADVVLPAYTYAEKDGTFTNKDRRVQRITKAIRAPEDSRDQVRILQELLQALGKPTEGMAAAPAVFDALAAEAKAFSGLTWEAIGLQGQTLPGK